MIHIIQLLCPSRHCFFGMAFDERDMKPEEAVSGLRELTALAVTRGEINPWCGICGSRDLHFEVGITEFGTIEEARPHLEKSEAMNIASRILLDAQGFTYDQQRKN